MLLLLDLLRDASLIYENSLQGFGFYLPSSWSSKATLLNRLHKEYQQKYFKLEQPTKAEIDTFNKELATAIVNLKTSILTNPKDSNDGSENNEMIDSMPLTKFDVITNLLKVCAECVLFTNKIDTAKNQFEQYKTLFPTYFTSTESSNYFIKKAYDFVCLSQHIYQSVYQQPNEQYNPLSFASSSLGYNEVLLQKARERIEQQTAKIISLENSLAKLTDEQIQTKEQHKNDLLHLAEKLRHAQESIPENEDSRRQIKFLLAGIDKLQQENMRLKKQISDAQGNADKFTTSSVSPAQVTTFRNNNSLFRPTPPSVTQVPGGYGLILNGTIVAPKCIENPSLPVNISNLVRRYGPPSQTS